LIGLFNIFVGILIILLFAQIWTKYENCVNRKVLYKYNAKTKYFIFIIVIFILEIITVTLIHLTFDTRFIDTIFVFIFFLLFMIVVVPYNASHFKNEQQAYNNFYLKTSKSLDLTVFTPKYTPFFQPL
jgi:hypothetical protein